MKKLMIVVLPLAVLASAGAASAQNNHDPLTKPWVLKMKEKQPEWYAKFEAAWKALQGARAKWKEDHGAWNTIRVDKAAAADAKHAAFTKRHETLVALRNAEIAWHQWHIDRKKFDLEKATENFTKWKERIAKATQKK
jgi:hypothetical protein